MEIIIALDNHIQWLPQALSQIQKLRLNCASASQGIVDEFCLVVTNVSASNFNIYFFQFFLKFLIAFSTADQGQNQRVDHWFG